jgi:hypothetical protein
MRAFIKRDSSVNVKAFKGNDPFILRDNLNAFPTGSNA